MKKIKLLVMKVRNFKGFKEVEFKMNGENVNILGPNGSGKTSSFDAFTWVLFGKDSKGDTKFQIKPLDENNNEIHNLNTEVEILLDVDGSNVHLKKVQMEKWSKQHGTEEKTFTNTTKYYIDEVPAKKKEYDEFVNSILNEEQFRLITSTTFFNEQIKWQERRKILFDLAGDITDEQVIASKKELQPLKEKLNGLTPAKRKLQVDEKRKVLKERISEITPRIDEASRNLPELDSDDSFVKENLNTLKSELDDLKQQKNNIVNGAAIINKENELRDLEFEKKEYKSKFESLSNVNVMEKKLEFQNKSNELNKIEYALDSLKMQLQGKYDFAKNLNNDKNSLLLFRKSLLEKYEKVKSLEYENPVLDCSCPTCKQDLPKEKIEEAEKNHFEEFNLDKSKQLKAIKEEGAPLKERISDIDEKLLSLKLDVDILNKEIADKEKEFESKNKEVSEIKLQLTELENNKPKIENDEFYKNIISKTKSLKDDLIELQSAASEVIKNIDLEITEKQKDIYELERNLGNLLNIESTKKRISELEQEQEELNEQYEELEYILSLINKFERAKASMVTDKVNSMFKFVTFKLFHEQMEGGIKETCETLYKGVSYQNGLNTAAKTNAGLDIINVLQNHNGVNAPVFLDNRESVVDLIETNAQVINLIVDGSKKKIEMQLLND